MENDDSKIDEQGRTRARRGRFFGPNQRIVGGNIEVNSLTLKEGELTFLLGTNGGILGQIFTRPGDPDIDGAGVDTVMEFINITGDEFKMTGDVVPAVDDTYYLGYSSRAWTLVYSNNAFQNVSDARTKKEVKNIEYGVETLKKLRPITFVRISDKSQRRQLGLIAQEVKEVVPEVVMGGDNGELHTIGYEALVPVLIKAIQELTARVEKLERDPK